MDANQSLLTNPSAAEVVEGAVGEDDDASSLVSSTTVASSMMAHDPSNISYSSDVYGSASPDTTTKRFLTSGSGGAGFMSPDHSSSPPPAVPQHRLLSASSAAAADAEGGGGRTGVEVTLQLHPSSPPPPPLPTPPPPPPMRQTREGDEEEEEDSLHSNTDDGDDHDGDDERSSRQADSPTPIKGKQLFDNTLDMSPPTDDMLPAVFAPSSAVTSALEHNNVVDDDDSNKDVDADGGNPLNNDTMYTTALMTSVVSLSRTLPDSGMVSLEKEKEKGSTSPPPPQLEPDLLMALDDSASPIVDRPLVHRSAEEEEAFEDADQGSTLPPSAIGNNNNNRTLTPGAAEFSSVQSSSAGRPLIRTNTQPPSVWTEDDRMAIAARKSKDGEANNNNNDAETMDAKKKALMLLSESEANLHLLATDESSSSQLASHSASQQHHSQRRSETEKTTQLTIIPHVSPGESRSGTFASPFTEEDDDERSASRPNRPNRPSLTDADDPVSSAVSSDSPSTATVTRHPARDSALAASREGRRPQDCDSLGGDDPDDADALRSLESTRVSVGRGCSVVSDSSPASPPPLIGAQPSTSMATLSLDSMSAFAPRQPVFVGQASATNAAINGRDDEHHHAASISNNNRSYRDAFSSDYSYSYSYTESERSRDADRRRRSVTGRRRGDVEVVADSSCSSLGDRRQDRRRASTAASPRSDSYASSSRSRSRSSYSYYSTEDDDDDEYYYDDDNNDRSLSRSNRRQHHSHSRRRSARWGASRPDDHYSGRPRPPYPQPQHNVSMPLSATEVVLPVIVPKPKARCCSWLPFRKTSPGSSPPSTAAITDGDNNNRENEATPLHAEYSFPSLPAERTRRSTSPPIDNEEEQQHANAEEGSGTVLLTHDNTAIRRERASAEVSLVAESMRRLIQPRSSPSSSSSAEEADVVTERPQQQEEEERDQDQEQHEQQQHTPTEQSMTHTSAVEDAELTAANDDTNGDNLPPPHDGTETQPLAKSSSSPFSSSGSHSVLCDDPEATPTDAAADALALPLPPLIQSSAAAVVVDDSIPVVSDPSNPEAQAGEVVVTHYSYKTDDAARTSSAAAVEMSSPAPVELMRPLEAENLLEDSGVNNIPILLSNTMKEKATPPKPLPKLYAYECKAALPFIYAYEFKEAIPFIYAWDAEPPHTPPPPAAVPLRDILPPQPPRTFCHVELQGLRQLILSTCGSLDGDGDDDINGSIQKRPAPSTSSITTYRYCQVRLAMHHALTGEKIATGTPFSLPRNAAALRDHFADGDTLADSRLDVLELMECAADQSSSSSVPVFVQLDWARLCEESVAVQRQPSSLPAAPSHDDVPSEMEAPAATTPKEESDDEQSEEQPVGEERPEEQTVDNDGQPAADLPTDATGDEPSLEETKPPLPDTPPPQPPQTLPTATAAADNDTAMMTSYAIKWTALAKSAALPLHMKDGPAFVIIPTTNDDTGGSAVTSVVLCATREMQYFLTASDAANMREGDTVALCKLRCGQTPAFYEESATPDSASPSYAHMPYTLSSVSRAPFSTKTDDYKLEAPVTILWKTMKGGARAAAEGSRPSTMAARRTYDGVSSRAVPGCCSVLMHCSMAVFEAMPGIANGSPFPHVKLQVSGGQEGLLGRTTGAAVYEDVCGSNSSAQQQRAPCAQFNLRVQTTLSTSEGTNTMLFAVHSAVADEVVFGIAFFNPFTFFLEENDAYRSSPSPSSLLMRRQMCLPLYTAFTSHSEASSLSSSPPTRVGWLLCECDCVFMRGDTQRTLSALNDLIARLPPVIPSELRRPTSDGGVLDFSVMGAVGLSAIGSASGNDDGSTNSFCEVEVLLRYEDDDVYYDGSAAAQGHSAAEEHASSSVITQTIEGSRCPRWAARYRLDTSNVAFVVLRVFHRVLSESKDPAAAGQVQLLGTVTLSSLMLLAMWRARFTGGSLWLPLTSTELVANMGAVLLSWCTSSQDEAWRRSAVADRSSMPLCVTWPSCADLTFAAEANASLSPDQEENTLCVVDRPLSSSSSAASRLSLELTRIRLSWPWLQHVRAAKGGSLRLTITASATAYADGWGHSTTLIPAAPLRSSSDRMQEEGDYTFEAFADAALCVPFANQMDWSVQWVPSDVSNVITGEDDASSAHALHIGSGSLRLSRDAIARLSRTPFHRENGVAQLVATEVLWTSPDGGATHTATTNAMVDDATDALMAPHHVERGFVSVGLRSFQKLRPSSCPAVEDSRAWLHLNDDDDYGNGLTQQQQQFRWVWPDVGIAAHIAMCVTEWFFFDPALSAATAASVGVTLVQKDALSGAGVEEDAAQPAAFVQRTMTPSPLDGLQHGADGRASRSPPSAGASVACLSYAETVADEGPPRTVLHGHWLPRRFPWFRQPPPTLGLALSVMCAVCDKAVCECVPSSSTSSSGPAAVALLPFLNALESNAGVAWLPLWRTVAQSSASSAAAQQEHIGYARVKYDHNFMKSSMGGSQLRICDSPPRCPKAVLVAEVKDLQLRQHQHAPATGDATPYIDAWAVVVGLNDYTFDLNVNTSSDGDDAALPRSQVVFPLADDRSTTPIVLRIQAQQQQASRLNGEIFIRCDVRDPCSRWIELYSYHDGAASRIEGEVLVQWRIISPSSDSNLVGRVRALCQDTVHIAADEHFHLGVDRESLWRGLAENQSAPIPIFASLSSSVAELRRVSAADEEEERDVAAQQRPHYLEISNIKWEMPPNLASQQRLIVMEEVWAVASVTHSLEDHNDDNNNNSNTRSFVDVTYRVPISTTEDNNSNNEKPTQRRDTTTPTDQPINWVKASLLLPLLVDSKASRAAQASAQVRLAVYAKVRSRTGEWAHARTMCVASATIPYYYGRQALSGATTLFIEAPFKSTAGGGVLHWRTSEAVRGLADGLPALASSSTSSFAPTLYSAPAEQALVLANICLTDVQIRGHALLQNDSLAATTQIRVRDVSSSSSSGSQNASLLVLTTDGSRRHWTGDVCVHNKARAELTVFLSRDQLPADVLADEEEEEGMFVKKDDLTVVVATGTIRLDFPRNALQACVASAPSSPSSKSPSTTSLKVSVELKDARSGRWLGQASALATAMATSARAHDAMSLFLQRKSRIVVSSCVGPVQGRLAHLQQLVHRHQLAKQQAVATAAASAPTGKRLPRAMRKQLLALGAELNEAIRVYLDESKQKDRAALRLQILSSSSSKKEEDDEDALSSKWFYPASAPTLICRTGEGAHTEGTDGAEPLLRYTHYQPIITDGQGDSEADDVLHRNIKLQARPTQGSEEEATEANGVDVGHGEVRVPLPSACPGVSPWRSGLPITSSSWTPLNSSHGLRVASAYTQVEADVSVVRGDVYLTCWRMRTVMKGSNAYTRGGMRPLRQPHIRVMHQFTDGRIYAQYARLSASEASSSSTPQTSTRWCIPTSMRMPRVGAFGARIVSVDLVDVLKGGEDVHCVATHSWCAQDEADASLSPWWLSMQSSEKKEHSPYQLLVAMSPSPQTEISSSSGHHKALSFEVTHMLMRPADEKQQECFSSTQAIRCHLDASSSSNKILVASPVMMADLHWTRVLTDTSPTTVQFISNKKDADSEATDESSAATVSGQYRVGWSPSQGVSSTANDEKESDDDAVLCRALFSSERMYRQQPVSHLLRFTITAGAAMQWEATCTMDDLVDGAHDDGGTASSDIKLYAASQTSENHPVGTLTVCWKLTTHSRGEMPIPLSEEFLSRPRVLDGRPETDIIASLFSAPHPPRTATTEQQKNKNKENEKEAVATTCTDAGCEEGDGATGDAAAAIRGIVGRARESVEDVERWLDSYEQQQKALEALKRHARSHWLWTLDGMEVESLRLTRINADAATAARDQRQPLPILARASLTVAPAKQHKKKNKNKSQDTEDKSGGEPTSPAASEEVVIGVSRTEAIPQQQQQQGCVDIYREQPLMRPPILYNGTCEALQWAVRTRDVSYASSRSRASLSVWQLLHAPAETAAADDTAARVAAVGATPLAGVFKELWVLTQRALCVFRSHHNHHDENEKATCEEDAYNAEEVPSTFQTNWLPLVGHSAPDAATPPRVRLHFRAPWADTKVSTLLRTFRPLCGPVLRPVIPREGGDGGGAVVCAALSDVSLSSATTPFLLENQSNLAVVISTTRTPISRFNSRFMPLSAMPSGDAEDKDKLNNGGLAQTLLPVHSLFSWILQQSETTGGSAEETDDDNNLILSIVSCHPHVQLSEKTVTQEIKCSDVKHTLGQVSVNLRSLASDMLSRRYRHRRGNADDCCAPQPAPLAVVSVEVPLKWLPDVTADAGNVPSMTMSLRCLLEPSKAQVTALQRYNTAHQAAREEQQKQQAGRRSCAMPRISWTYLCPPASPPDLSTLCVTDAGWSIEGLNVIQGAVGATTTTTTISRSSSHCNALPQVCIAGGMAQPRNRGHARTQQPGTTMMLMGASLLDNPARRILKLRRGGSAATAASSFFSPPTVPEFTMQWQSLPMADGARGAGTCCYDCCGQIVVYHDEHRDGGDSGRAAVFIDGGLRRIPMEGKKKTAEMRSQSASRQQQTRQKGELQHMTYHGHPTILLEQQRLTRHNNTQSEDAAEPPSMRWAQQEILHSAAHDNHHSYVGHAAAVVGNRVWLVGGWRMDRHGTLPAAPVLVPASSKKGLVERRRLEVQGAAADKVCAAAPAAEEAGVEPSQAHLEWSDAVRCAALSDLSAPVVTVSIGHDDGGGEGVGADQTHKLSSDKSNCGPTWAESEPLSQAPAVSYHVAMAAPSRFVFMFGGLKPKNDDSDGTCECTSDVYAFDTIRLRWYKQQHQQQSENGCWPVARYGHTVTPLPHYQEERLLSTDTSSSSSATPLGKTRAYLVCGGALSASQLVPLTEMLWVCVVSAEQGCQWHRLRVPSSPSQLLAPRFCPVVLFNWNDGRLLGDHRQRDGTTTKEADDKTWVTGTVVLMGGTSKRATDTSAAARPSGVFNTYVEPWLTGAMCESVMLPVAACRTK